MECSHERRIVVWNNRRFAGFVVDCVLAAARRRHVLADGLLLLGHERVSPKLGVRSGCMADVYVPGRVLLVSSQALCRGCVH